MPAIRQQGCAVTDGGRQGAGDGLLQQRELLTVVMAANHSQPYLYKQEFRLRTDHPSPLWLHKRTKPSHQVARWLEYLTEFRFQGDLDQSFAGSQPSNTQLKLVSMAQKQLDQQPLELTDMWHHSNDEERKEKWLPGKGLVISWVSATTNCSITNQFYKLQLERKNV